MNNVVIVGGGITGLAAAYLAAKSGARVTLLEASDQIGGLLRTFEVGGNRLEWFYHVHFTHDAELHWLLRELGIESRMEYRPATMGVYRGGRMYDFNTVRDLLRFKPMNFFDKARFALTSVYLARGMQWQRNEHVPALDWFYKYAGRRATESLWAPMLRVKFGPYAEQTPLAWMIGRLRQRLTSRKAGRETFGYLRGSLQVLLEALVRSLSAMGVQVRTGVSVRGMTLRAGEIAELQTTVGPVTADAYLFTIPTIHLAEVLPPECGDYAAQLRRIEYFGAACTILELKRSLSPHFWLNIADPGFPFGGIIEHTSLIPPSHYDGRHIVYLSRYFAASDDLARQTPAAVEEIMWQGLKRIHPDLTEADVLRTQVITSRTAATVCDLNFSRKVPECRSPVKRLYVAAMPHIYPDERSCNNSIRIAAEACRVMGLKAPEVPRGGSMSGSINMD